MSGLINNRTSSESLIGEHDPARPMAEDTLLADDICST
jgi:hypothetical protein